MIHATSAVNHHDVRGFVSDWARDGHTMCWSRQAAPADARYFFLEGIPLGSWR
jgi:hypothetical protein